MARAGLPPFGFERRVTRRRDPERRPLFTLLEADQAKVEQVLRVAIVSTAVAAVERGEAAQKFLIKFHFPYSNDCPRNSSGNPLLCFAHVAQLDVRMRLRPLIRRGHPVRYGGHWSPLHVWPSLTK